MKCQQDYGFSSLFQEIQDVCRKPQSVPEDDDNTEGGIDITKARQRLAEEDKYDKKLYRQRIKQMHQVSVFTGSNSL